MATVASLVVDLTANTAKFQRNFSQAHRTIDKFTRAARSVTRTLDDVARVGKKAGIGLAAITAAATGVLKTTADFEKGMMRVKAVSQATVAQYKEMEQTALRSPRPRNILLTRSPTAWAIWRWPASRPTRSSRPCPQLFALLQLVRWTLPHPLTRHEYPDWLWPCSRGPGSGY